MPELRIIYGIHAVHNAIKRQPAAVHEVWLDKDRRDKRLADIARLSQNHAVECRRASRSELDALTEGEKHQGVVARVSNQASLTESELLDCLVDNPAPLVLVLDGVQDPHNLGACLRTADAAGVDALVIPKDRSVGITATVEKVASGAAQAVSLVPVTNLARTLDRFKQLGLWITGADDKAEQCIFDLDFTGPSVLVLGAEGSGLRRLTKEKCDFLVNLPMAGVVSSLNVSVAAGVCLFEAVRQRRARQ
jgi:23S rRNA (guanosine2251-2'-O)-methyltransferase